jgi:arylsulfatase A-like enzyme
LRFTDARPRVAVLDLAAFPGVPGQTAAVRLNGRPAGAIEVRQERRRVRIELPRDLQKKGENRLGLRFTAAAEPRPPAGHRYAARLYGLVVGEPSRALDALLAEGAPPFSFWPEKRALVQAGPSRLHWAHRWAGSALHVAGSLRSPPGNARGATLRVTADDGSEQRELWRGWVDAAAPDTDDTWIRLPADAADRRITLSVDPAQAGEPVWVTWRDLEIVPALPGAGATATPRAAPPARNVVVVVFDAAQASHFGCYGYEHDTTPEVDRVAADGVVFERAYTTAPFTLSAMGSVWTSLLPDEHHRDAAHDDALPEGTLTLAELLSANGVHTAGFVGNGMAGRGFGLHRGFKEFTYPGYSAGEMRAALDRWIAGAPRGRFMLYVHYRQPHTPLDPPPPLDTRFGSGRPLPPEALDRWLEAVNSRDHRPTAAELALYRQLYDGNLAVADHELGWLRGRLQQAGLWEDTLLIVTADHGEALYEHGFLGHNSQLYEESLRVPLVVRFPNGATARGTRVATPVGLLDIAPTVAGAFGIPGEGRPPFRGRNLLHSARGAPGRGELLARSAGPWPSYALVDGRRKYIFNSRYGAEELYDLASDPGEHTDLAGRQRVLASVYRQRMYRRLLDLPGRWTGAAARWHAPDHREREDLRALGYVK